ncbi:ChaN family lipoprotein [Castellaniella sp.]|uniref:ChaN family lipoprotein n=1 Tax=Castellaniella sp. TaxID=1955812 RepID=UPI002AFF9290|nr:ChaN family lipoprotein [Castellaniella sp.]
MTGAAHRSFPLSAAARRLACGLLALLLTACQHLPDAGDAGHRPRTLSQAAAQGRIQSLAGGGTLTPDALLEELAQADIVIVGERHDAYPHHQIEEWLVRTLPLRRPAGSYVLEMATVSQQARIDAAQRAFPEARPTDEALQAQLAWSRGWPWRQYGGLVTALMAQPAPVLAANLDRPEVENILRSGARPAGTLSGDPAIARTLADTIADSHGMRAGDDRLDGMIAVQMQRDRRMAGTLLRAPKPAILFTGNIHALKTLGVPVHLRDLRADQTLPRVKVLLLAEESAGFDGRHADYLWTGL